MEERICAYRVLVERTEGKRPLGRLGVDGRIILKIIAEVRWEGLDWIDLVQDRDSWPVLVNAVMNFLLKKDCAPCS